MSPCSQWQGSNNLEIVLFLIHSAVNHNLEHESIGWLFALERDSKDTILEAILDRHDDHLFLIQLSMSNLNEVDPVTKLPLHDLLAGTGEKICDLNTLFYLLQKHPEYADAYCTKKPKKRQRGEDS